MNVQVIDGLPAVVSRVDHHAVSLGKIVLAGQVRPNPQQVAKQGRVLLACFSQRNKMFAGRDQNVNWRLRIDIGKSVAFVILVDSRRRDASFNDLAEKAAHNGTSVQERLGA
jgi:hypothetical protein